jgi:hypothetical protein
MLRGRPPKESSIDTAASSVQQSLGLETRRFEAMNAWVGRPVRRSSIFQLLHRSIASLASCRQLFVPRYAQACVCACDPAAVRIFSRFWQEGIRHPRAAAGTTSRRTTRLEALVSRILTVALLARMHIGSHVIAADRYLQDETSDAISHAPAGWICCGPRHAYTLRNVLPRCVLCLFISHTLISFS